MTKSIDPFYLQAKLLTEVIRRVLERKADLALSSPPVLQKRPITEFRKRMRVSGLDKFIDKTYISTVNYYLTQEDMAKHRSIGAVIIYIPETHLPRLMKDLNYPGDVEEDDEEAMKDAIGTFCNLIAGNFKTGLTQLEYQELLMSHFSTYINDVVSGVEYHPGQKDVYEISFEIRGEKRIVADLTMGPVPKDDNMPSY